MSGFTDSHGPQPTMDHRPVPGRWSIVSCLLLIGFFVNLAHAQTVTPPAAVNFNSVAVGTTSGTRTLTFAFTGSVTLGAPVALTLGAPNLDFAIASGGTCTSGSVQTASCTVNVTFTPKYPGARNGVVNLVSGGATIATAYVYGNGIGPQAVFNDAALATLATVNSGYGVVVDGYGNAYVTDTSSVYKIAAGTGTVTTLADGFAVAYGVGGVDGAGNVYVADMGRSAIQVIAPTGAVTALGSGLADPMGVAVDGAGNVYVVESPDGLVRVLAAGTGAVTTTLDSGASGGRGVAVDGAGNVYVVTMDDTVVKITASTGIVTPLDGDFSNPEGVAVDGVGNVYVADSGDGAVKIMPVGCTSASCATTLVSGLNDSYGVAVDGAGNVWIVNQGDGAVMKIPRATPPSMSFATTDVGATSTDSPQTVSIQNIGNAALTLPALPAGFALDAATTTCTASLAINAICTLGIDFTPVTGQQGKITASYTLDAATLPIALFGAAPLSPTVPAPLDARAMLALLVLLAGAGVGAMRTAQRHTGMR